MGRLEIVFEEKLEKLQATHYEYSSNESLSSAKSKVIKNASISIKMGMERQLEGVKFYRDGEGDLSLIPYTYSSAESNFAKLNHSFNQTAGSFVSLKNQHPTKIFYNAAKLAWILIMKIKRLPCFGPGIVKNQWITGS